jgi:hypothetical protein
MKESPGNFENTEQELQCFEKQCEMLDKNEEVKAITDIRSAIRSTGKNASGIKHMGQSDADQGGGKQALASYNEGNDQISMVGSRQLIEGARQTGVHVRTYAQSILTHEMTHQRSRNTSGAKAVDGLLTWIFGREAVHNTEEAAASQAEGAMPTSQFDSYSHERNETAKYASELNMSNRELLKIRIDGDAGTLAKAAHDTGLLNAS